MLPPKCEISGHQDHARCAFLFVRIKLLHGAVICLGQKPITVSSYIFML